MTEPPSQVSNLAVSRAPARIVESTFEITRDDAASGGYHIAEVRDGPTPGQGPTFVAIGAVDPNGPAARAGMTQEHIGWRITGVNGEVVTVSNCAELMNSTRAPGRTFALKIRRPQTGEITFSHVDLNTNAHNAYMVSRAEDLDISIDRSGVTIRVRLGANSDPARVAQLTEAIQRHVEETFRQLRDMRDNLSEEELQRLEQEEEEAAAKDEATEDADLRCVVCLESKRAIVYSPCQHLATCHRCTVMIRRSSICPLCRKPIEDFLLESELKEGDTVYRP